MWQKCFLSALYEEMDVFEKKGRGLGTGRLGAAVALGIEFAH